ncbi:MAG: hypothetical protein WCQ95_07570 [Bacteroidota bacterium]
MQRYYNKKIRLLLATLIFIILVFSTSWFSLKYHDTKGIRNWRCEMYADAAAYNVYLPALFIYHWNGKSFPVAIEKQTGYGFKIDGNTGKITTKVTCGVAFLQMPFFLVANHISNQYLGGTDGYNYLNFRIIDLAGCFYLWLGFFFIFFTLRRRFSFLLTLATTFFVVFGSNIFFYGFVQPGMSHIYSFSVFAGFLCYFDSISESRRYRFRQLFIIGLLLGFATLIRPTNIFIGLAFLFWNTFSLTDIKVRIKKFFTWKNSLFMLLPFVLVMIPQMCFWYFTYGTPIVYSYPGEGFTHLASPQFLQLWFEPNNGLFPYAPVFVLVLLGMVVAIVKKHKGSFLPPVLFVLMSYLFASWYVVAFGCAFGCRPFAEYFVFFALPLASLIHYTRPWYLKSLIILVALVCMLFSMKLTLTYNDNRFFSEKKWDWHEYQSIIYRGVRSTGQDFETCKIDFKNLKETSDAQHGKYVLAFNHSIDYSPVILEENYTKSTCSPWRYADISVQVKADTAVTFLLITIVDSCGKQVKWGSTDIKYDENKLNQWQTFRFYDMWIGGNYGDGVLLKYYIWNSDRYSFEFDNMKVLLH